VKLSYLWHGTPGHPIHPPLTDATIGIYTFAAVAGVLSALGVAEEQFAHGWWLALIVGLITSAVTALTGLLEWMAISPDTPLKRTATTHGLVNLGATGFFALAAIVGHDSYADDAVGGGSLVLTLLGFAVLTLGGWLGGTIVYVHGMRVLGLEEEPARQAAAPQPAPEEEAAEKL
jgi:uncharacterized membrane protein